MKRKASAVWKGNLKQGNGALSTPSGVLKDTPYSFAKRFENEAGTNPEELIAAAHAGCFTMALSAALEGAGFVADELATDAEVTLEQLEGSWTISAVHLTLVATVKQITEGQFKTVAEGAKKNCPVSKLLNARITLDATLKS